MHNPKLSIRYAQALFDLALEQGVTDEVNSDMELLVNTCNQNPALVHMLNSPVINSGKKITVMNGIFSKEIGKLSLAFIGIIIRKRRESLLVEIAGKFADLFLDYKMVKRVKVTSATPLDDNTRKELLDLLASQTGCSILLDEAVDANLLGGLVVKLENRIFDDTVRKKLQNLRKEFSKNIYTSKV